MDILLLALIIVFAQTVETAMGFGSTIIALAIGAHIMGMEKLIPILVLIGIAQSAWIVAQSWERINWQFLFIRIIHFCAIGLFAGRYVVSIITGDILKTIFGIFVIIVSLAEFYKLLMKNLSMRRLPAPVGYALLFAGGIIHGIYATGGPLIVYYTSREIRKKDEFRATLSMLWLILNTILLASWFAVGSLTSTVAITAACLLPALFLGIAAGEFLHNRVNEHIFRLAAQTLLLVVRSFLIC